MREERRRARPQAEGEQLIVNSEFAAPPASRGFDWRLPVVEGISFSREDESRGLRVTFSGRQPEDCEVLVQLVAVHSQVPYDLSFVYRTQGLANAKGIVWRITMPAAMPAMAPSWGRRRARRPTPMPRADCHSRRVRRAAWCGWR